MSLINKEPKEYGKNFNDHILEQWKTVVEMADSTSNRRISSSNVFILINTAILAFISFEVGFTNLIISIIGIVISVVWICSIKSYKKINKIKFKVINELETFLPASTYGYEWKLINENKRHKHFTTLESFIPFIFIIMYITVIIINICMFIYKKQT